MAPHDFLKTIFIHSIIPDGIQARVVTMSCWKQFFFFIYTNKHSKTIVIIEKGIRSSLQVVL